MKAHSRRFGVGAHQLLEYDQQWPSQNESTTPATLLAAARSTGAMAAAAGQRMECSLNRHRKWSAAVTCIIADSIF
ncbi:unnamed protein product [Urochloa humidicola]